MTDWDPITLYQCDVCEWAATTGDPWDRCPYCDTVVPPRRREVVYLSDAKHEVARVNPGGHGWTKPVKSPEKRFDSRWNAA